MWNALVKVLNDKNIDDQKKKLAKLYLNQLNTAGGPNMIRKEVEQFLKSI